VWPAQVGPQNLYPLDLRFEVDGEVSDATHIQFGVREVTSEIDAHGHRLFHINGKPILIRGAGYSFDLLLRSSPERQEAELKYVLLGDPQPDEWRPGREPRPACRTWR